MSEIRTKEQQVERGQRAQALLDNELLKESIAELRAKYFAEWAATSIEDIAGRERLYVAHQLLEQVMGHLRIIVADGKLAASHVEKLKGKVR